MSDVDPRLVAAMRQQLALMPVESGDAVVAEMGVLGRVGVRIA